MKYFVLLICLLMTVAYKIAHINDEALSRAEQETKDSSIQDKYKEIDLAKVTLRNPKIPQGPDIDSKAMDFSDTDPSYYDQEFAEGNPELLESKFSGDAAERHKPDMNIEATQELIRELKKEN